MNVYLRDFPQPSENELATTLIQNAIDICAENGGGSVIFDSTKYTTGTIYIKSGVYLNLPYGCVLQGSKNLDDYNAADAWPQNTVYKEEHMSGGHLIVMLEVSNCGIYGGGTIDGNGEYLSGRAEKAQIHMGPYYADETFLRPAQMVYLCESDHVVIKDIELRNSPYWSCYVLGCKDVMIEGVRIKNSPKIINGDGIDIDSSHRVTVTHCHIETEDDSLTLRCCNSKLKNNKMTCEDINISNCALSACHANAIRIGVGSGAIRNLNVTNLTVRNSRKVICMEAQYVTQTPERPGCILENFSFSNIVFQDARYFLYLSTCALGVPFENPRIPSPPIRNIFFSDIRGNLRNNIVIQGNPGDVVKNITFRNMALLFNRNPRPMPPGNPNDEWAEVTTPGVFFIRNASRVRMEHILAEASGETPFFEKMTVEENCKDILMEDCTLEITEN